MNSRRCQVRAAQRSCPGTQTITELNTASPNRRRMAGSGSHTPLHLKVFELQEREGHNRSYQVIQTHMNASGSNGHSRKHLLRLTYLATYLATRNKRLWAKLMGTSLEMTKSFPNTLALVVGQTEFKKINIRNIQKFRTFCTFQTWNHKLFNSVIFPG